MITTDTTQKTDWFDVVEPEEIKYWAIKLGIGSGRPFPNKFPMAPDNCAVVFDSEAAALNGCDFQGYKDASVHEVTRERVNEVVRRLIGRYQVAVLDREFNVVEEWTV